jgi:hypothetical protein
MSLLHAWSQTLHRKGTAFVSAIADDILFPIPAHFAFKDGSCEGLAVRWQNALRPAAQE